MKASTFRFAASMVCCAGLAAGVSVVPAGCSSIMKDLPGGDLVSGALGLDLPFVISGAPKDDVLRVIYYAEQTSTMVDAMDSTGRKLADEFARTFDLKVNSKTDAGLAEMASASAELTAESLSAEQRQWLETNLPLLVGWSFAASNLASSATSFSISLPDAIKTASDAPGQYGPTVVSSADDLRANLTNAFEKLEPVFKSNGSMIQNLIRLSEAVGVTPPTPEEERAEASKLASKSLPEGTEVEFS